MFFWRKWHRDWLLADPKRLGRWGERCAEKALRRKGFTVLDRNFRMSDGEIDIVAADPEGTVVFVEVKTRASERFTPVETAVTRGKQHRMLLAARAFLSKHNIANRPCRFDFLGIVLGPEGPDMRHYEGAFYAAERS
ncbi:MAG TPA: YraN family protein [Sedimentisphaerales bacterium]|nr:YraN family protein [Sedimentisphaerales bacterium]